jgi:hypothetical protein
VSYKKQELLTLCQDGRHSAIALLLKAAFSFLCSLLFLVVLPNLLVFCVNKSAGTHAALLKQQSEGTHAALLKQQSAGTHAALLKQQSAGTHAAHNFSGDRH